MSTTYPHKGKREAPYSLRLTDKERAWLRDRAGNISLGTYIKSVLFSDSTIKPRTRKSPVKNDKALADVLACLGASRIANNLNQLAKAANVGNLYFDEDTKRALIQACDDIRIMRQLLMMALGLPADHQPKPKESVSQGFARAAADPEPATPKKRFAL